MPFGLAEAGDPLGRGRELDALAGWVPRRAGPTASVLDGLADRYADTLIIGGVTALAYQDGGGVGALAAGGAALAACVILAYAGARVRASADDATAGAVFGYTGRDVRLALLAVSLPAICFSMISLAM